MADEKSKKKPRIRKVETVRERAEKHNAKAEAKANKVPKRRVRRTLGFAAKPFRAPARIVSRPFRTRPARFLGRWIGRILWPRYFRNAWAEIRQVEWPSRATTWKLTFAVLAFAVVFGLAAAGIDWVLDKVIRRIVFKA